MSQTAHLWKGTDLIALRSFIKRKFDQAGYKEWLAALEPEVQQVYFGQILTSGWFDAEKFFLKPLETMSLKWYDNDIKKGCWDFNRYSAEHAFRGIYRVFLKIGSIRFLLKFASKVLSLYVKPGYAVPAELDKNTFSIKFFETPPRISADYCLAAFVAHTFEIIGFKVINTELTKSISLNDPYSEITITYQ